MFDFLDFLATLALVAWFFRVRRAEDARRRTEDRKAEVLEVLAAEARENFRRGLLPLTEADACLARRLDEVEQRLNDLIRRKVAGRD